MMFVPGNNPGMMADAHIYGPDSLNNNCKKNLKLFLQQLLGISTNNLYIYHKNGKSHWALLHTQKLLSTWHST